ncbi:hypothetical protein BDR04DRAFT_961557, partial [Suillus decipiens]
QNLRERFGHFRVLIMGRANAGKTTNLQKVCNTTDHLEIYDTKGNKVRVMIHATHMSIADEYIQCGNHDIKNEMVFTTNPRFVFHDSYGFKASSADKFESMKKFISECSNVMKLED